MYRFYGLSDKIDNDKTVGYMGIGSKSPFAYTDSFTTVSYYNGKKYLYINAKDKSGIPTINKMGEFDTIEENGLEISFGVKKEDISHFKTAVNNTFTYFPEYPEGITPPEKKKVLFTGKKSKWIAIKDSYSWEKEIDLVIGYIKYSIKLKNIPSNLYVQNLQSQSLIPNTRIVLYTNIEDVDISASRESLQYTEKTVKYIENRTKEVREEYIEHVSDLVSKCHSVYEASKKVCVDQLVPLNDINSFKYCGKKLSYSFPLSFCCFQYHKNKRRKECCVISINDICAINDLGKSGTSRIKQYMKENNITGYVLIEKENLEKAKQELGAIDDDFIFASNLPHVVKIGNATNSNITPIMYVFNGSYTNLRHNWRYIANPIYVKKYMEEENNLCYVVLERFNIRYFDALLHPKYLSNLVKLLSFITKTENYNIIGVSSRNEKKIKEYKNCSNFVNLLTKELQKYINNNQDFLEWLSYNAYKFNPKLDIDQILSIKIKDLKDVELKDIITNISKINEKYSTIQNYEILTTRPIIKIKEKYSTVIENHKNTLYLRLDSICNKYPLLKHIDISNVQSEYITDYLNLVHLKKGEKDD
jgi:hypothetical protein